MNTKCLMIGLVVAIFSSPAPAQNSLTGALSLRDAMEATLARHPRLRSFPFRAESLAGERDLANLRPAKAT